MEDIKVDVVGGSMDDSERNAYVERALEMYGKQHTLKEITIILNKDDPEHVDIKYVFEKQPFDRIRRITGYLVGTVDRWNDAKKHELADRERHLEARHHCDECHRFRNEGGSGVGWCSLKDRRVYQTDDVCDSFSRPDVPPCCDSCG